METAFSRRATNKTAYNHKITHATPPSPSSSSPSLIQSTSLISTSTPSTSPPLPTTPPRSSRSKTRYPDLGRVPLHRRGTSKTYECLEDLLREAGYKETRVFTPEGEHAEASSGKQEDQLGDQQGGVRNSVGAFVGFLAGFIPAASRSTSSLGTTVDAYSPPVSPLAQKEMRKAQETALSNEYPHMTSSLESLDPTPRANRLKPPSRTTMAAPHFSISSRFQSCQKGPPIHSTHRASNQYHHLSSRRSTAPVQPPQTSPLPLAGPSCQHIAQPQPSRAGAYLRHIASAPNMAKRHASAAKRQRAFTDDNESESQRNENSQPPLPPSWIKTVARAVLFGGVGAYIGGPSDDEPARSPTRGKTLRSTRSSLSQASPHQHTKHRERRFAHGGLSDTTNMKKGANGELFAPPELFTRIERGRATTSAGEVSRTRVVCRSAPASRAPSPMRGGSDEAREKRDRDRKERARLKDLGRGRATERQRRLPSLANTQTEGDKWAHNGKRVRDKGKGSKAGEAKNRYLSGWGMDGESSDEGGDGRITSSEEEEELDLARMLVNPKRQNSIVSLRRHLNDETSGAAGKLRRSSGARIGPGLSVGTAQASRSGSVQQRIVEDQDWDASETEDWGQGWVRKSARRMTSDDNDDENSAGFLVESRTGRGGRMFGSGRSGTGRSRLGIPGTWGLIGGGS